LTNDLLVRDLVENAFVFDRHRRIQPHLELIRQQSVLDLSAGSFRTIDTFAEPSVDRLFAGRPVDLSVVICGQ
jgi:hypothetical protein